MRSFSQLASASGAWHGHGALVNVPSRDNASACGAGIPTALRSSEKQRTLGGPADKKMQNPTFGSGQHSHEVPVIPGVVVEMRDGAHAGTAVWRRDHRVPFVFASYDTNEVQYAPRCVLVRGQKIDDLDERTVSYACDLEPSDGLCLVGVDNDDDLAWLSEDAVVLWDSAHQVEDAADADHVIPIEQLALAEALRFRSEHGLTDFDRGWAQRSWDRVLPTGTFDEWLCLIRKFYNQIAGEWI
jgi:hypothetical protein